MWSPQLGTPRCWKGRILFFTCNTSSDPAAGSVFVYRFLQESHLGAAVQWPWGQCGRIDTEELGQANCELEIADAVVLIDLLLIFVNRISIMIKAGFEGIGQLLNPNGRYALLLAGGDGPYLVSTALGEEDHCLGWIEYHVREFPRSVQPVVRSGGSMMAVRAALARFPCCS